MRGTMIDKKLVIANNYEQFRQYCLFNNLNFKEYKGLISPADIVGYANTELLIFGDFRNLSSYMDKESIQEYCNTHNIKITYQEAL
jgi:hypothetical protein